jgi:hypothetical protein
VPKKVVQTAPTIQIEQMGAINMCIMHAALAITVTCISPSRIRESYRLGAKSGQVFEKP